MRSLFVLLTGVALAAPVVAETPAGVRTITTSATATVYVKPDVARIHYGIRISEPSPDAVKDIMAKTTKTMDEAIAKLKLTTMKITTGPLSIKQAGANALGAIAVGVGGGVGGAPGMGMMQPYIGQSSHTATITDSDPEKLRAAIDAFVKAVTETGCNSSGSDDQSNPFLGFGQQEPGGGPKVVLARSDDSAARDEALQKATEKAMKNAKTLVKALGGGEIKVLSITDVEPESPTLNFNALLMDAKADSPRPPAGEIEVKVRVTLKVSY